MIIGIDVEGTITTAPDFFAWLTAALLRDGHKVFIITMRTHHEDTSLELEQLGIRYTEVITPEASVFERPDADRWKSEVCSHLGIDVMFDDSMDILRHLPRFTKAFQCHA